MWHTEADVRRLLLAFILVVTPITTDAHGILETFSFIKYILVQGAALVIAIAALGFFIVHVVWSLKSRSMAIAIAIFGGASMILYTFVVGLPGGLQLSPLKSSFGPGQGPGLSIPAVFSFFQHIHDFEHVADIARDPNEVPSPRTHSTSTETGDIVEIFLETKEVLSEMGPDITMSYWTFNGKVPGPMLRVKKGDTVKITITNNVTSLHHHNVDLHAATGPGGGAVVTTVAPGETKTFSFKALNPGLYVYHCAVANVPNHMAHGMYGMILVEPEGGLPPVDKEFYVMQGEFYSTGGIGNKGLQVFDTQAMLDGTPTYVVFNGRTGGLNGKMQAQVGDTVRIYFGNGGVNLISSFHVIGEIFDTVYPEGSLGGEVHKNVQTTAVPAGGATIVEFKVEYPGKYILVDHALARLDKGAWGVLEVMGEKNPEIFDGDFSNPGEGH